MATANEELFDSVLRHQIRLRRYSLWEARRIARTLDETEADLVRLLQDRLGRLAGGAVRPATLKRLEAVLKSVREQRAAVWQAVRAQSDAALDELAKDEARRETRVLDDAIPVDFETAVPPLGRVAAAARARPFQGRPLRDWYASLEAADRRRLDSAIRLGVVEGETVDQIVRRVRGTAAAGFEDGVLAMSRRDAAAVVRTAVNHVSTVAREEVWAANSDIISGLRWTSVLDGRTSAVCRARDGTIYEVNSGPRPPAHVGCRSVMTPMLDGLGVLGKRPTVVDTRTPERREVDFKAQAKATGRSVAAVRQAWAKANVGSAPAETTYSGFLRRQSAAFQDEVLGKAKGQLFRAGKLDLDAFVDRAGNELTLGQLRETQPSAWRRAFGTEQ